MQAVDISIITVTYNSAARIAACVESVQMQTDVSFEIIVVDNASMDDTREKLKGLNCRVIFSRENLGFGSGCNLGFAASSGRYIYLLNPDARLAGNNSLAEMCHRMDANPRWGMAGTRVLSEDGNYENPPSATYPGQRHVHRDFSALPGKIAWIVGASMIIRRELYKRLGGFDTGFFLYSEETDLCLRLRELDFEIGHIAEVAIHHIGGASETGRDPCEISARKLQGLLRFRQKHYPPADCEFLARRDLRRAWLRMIWNGLLAGLQPHRSKTWQKHRIYRGVWQVSRDFLKQNKTMR